MSTPAQKKLKDLIKTLKWADEMFKNGMTAGDVDIEAIASETVAVLQQRRGDVLCSEIENGRRCMLSFAHNNGPTPTPHQFDSRPITIWLSFDEVVELRKMASKPHYTFPDKIGGVGFEG